MIKVVVFSVIAWKLITESYDDYVDADESVGINR